jgi:hypothetical protein
LIPVELDGILRLLQPEDQFYWGDTENSDPFFFAAYSSLFNACFIPFVKTKQNQIMQSSLHVSFCLVLSSFSR